MFRGLVLVGFLVLFLSLPVLADWQTFTGTITDNNSTVYLGRYDPFSSTCKGVQFWFRITQADTSIVDSVTMILQTSRDNDWYNVRAFPEMIEDTCTIYKYFPTESLLVYPFENNLRILLAFTDTITDPDSGVLFPTGDTILNKWNQSDADSANHFMYVNDGTTVLDSLWVVVTGVGVSPEDSLEIFRFSNNPKRSAYIDSVVLRFNACWATDTACLAWGVGIDDTNTVVWNQSRITGTLLTKTATGSYQQCMTTIPGTTSSWTPDAITHTIAVFQPARVVATGEIRLHRVFLDIYYKKGYFSPAVEWQVEYRVIR